MEALTAASVAALTVYDMVKGVERAVQISSVRLVSKSGGESGTWHREPGQDEGPAGVPGPRTSHGPKAPRDRSAGRIGRQRRG